MHANRLDPSSGMGNMPNNKPSWVCHWSQFLQRLLIPLDLVSFDRWHYNTLFLWVFAGILVALRRGCLLPAGSTTSWVGALAVQAWMWKWFSWVWLCCGSCGPRAWRQNQRERPPRRDWGCLSQYQRCHVKLSQGHLEPRFHTCPTLSSHWILPPELCPGIPNNFGLKSHIRLNEALDSL